MKTVSFFSGLALTLAIGAGFSVADRDGMRTLILGTATAAAVAIAGAAAADNAAARRQS